MKKLFYASLILLSLSQSSCTMMVKGLVKAVVKGYNDHTDMNVSSFQLADQQGKQHTFSSLYGGKTVYFYVWASPSNRPPGEKNDDYTALKKRFAKYPDVVFADFFIGEDQAAWTADDKKNAGQNSYFLVRNEASRNFFSALKESTMVPFIVGKDGKMLAFKGPKPSDHTLVDYVLYEARNDIDGTASAKALVRGVNSSEKFKTQLLKDWYQGQFNRNPDKVNFSVSSTQ